jgi:DHA2 family multidrug resistance protein
VTITACAVTPRSVTGASGWLLVAGVVLATLAEAVAGTVLALGRFDIIGDVHATSDEFAWLDIGYVGLKLIGFLATPWLLTRWSPRNVLLVSTLTLGVASGLAAFIVQLDLLVLLRAVQGLAGAGLLVSGQTLLFLAFPRAQQPILQALFAVGAVVAPTALAPALQGWLIDSQSWVWIFSSVTPIAFGAAGLILLADDVPAAGPEGLPFDGLSLALVSVAMLSLTYVLSQGSRWDWFEAPRIVVLTLLGVGALAMLILLQRRATGPALFDWSIFRSDNFTFAFLVSFVAGAALLGSAYLIPTFVVSVLAFTPTDAGLLLLPSGAVFVVSLLLAAALIQLRRLPPIATVPVGILLFMAAMAMLSGANAESGADTLTPAILVRGFGLGFLFLSLTLIAFGDLTPRNLAYGIGLFNLGRQAGGLIGIAGLQTVIDHQIVANQAILGASITPGMSAVGDRIASTAMALVTKGLDPGAAAKAAAMALGRSVGHQATAIAFETAFAAVALLFAVAAPVLVAFKIGLARRRGRAAALPGAA